ncbi:MAG: hypothetical protein HYW33_03255 [Candidatus Blackburnbacteria bacterium]|nr:hypothetical protein [Candidatus Blackburnbacteria bacterium]
MPTLLRKRNPCKHRREIQLTAAERARVLASGRFMPEELGKPLHKARVQEIFAILGLGGRGSAPPDPVQTPVRASKSAPGVLDQAAVPAPHPSAPVSELPASMVSGVEAVPREEELQIYYRPWPGEFSDEELEAMSC